MRVDFSFGESKGAVRSGEGVRIFVYDVDTERCGAVWHRKVGRCGSVITVKNRTAPHRSRTVAKYLISKTPTPDRGFYFVKIEQSGAVRCGF